jgi:hypothetical protein
LIKEAEKYGAHPCAGTTGAKTSTNPPSTPASKQASALWRTRYGKFLKLHEDIKEGAARKKYSRKKLKFKKKKYF